MCADFCVRSDFLESCLRPARGGWFWGVFLPPFFSRCRSLSGPQTACFGLLDPDFIASTGMSE